MDCWRQFYVQIIWSLHENNYGGEENGYIKQHYNLLSFCTGSLNQTMRNRNVLGHVRNNFIQAINEQTLFPKAVLFVLEADLISAINHFKIGADNAFASVVNWLATKVEHAISAHKEKLPTKSRKFKFPQVFWALPVFHSRFKDNQYREKFKESTINMIAKHRGMHTLCLHAWNPQDRHLVINSSMTDQGYR